MFSCYVTKSKKLYGIIIKQELLQWCKHLGRAKGATLKIVADFFVSQQARGSYATSGGKGGGHMEGAGRRGGDNDSNVCAKKRTNLGEEPPCCGANSSHFCDAPNPFPSRLWPSQKVNAAMGEAFSHFLQGEYSGRGRQMSQHSVVEETWE